MRFALNCIKILATGNNWLFHSKSLYDNMHIYYDCYQLRSHSIQTTERVDELNFHFRHMCLGGRVFVSDKIHWTAYNALDQLHIFVPIIEPHKSLWFIVNGEVAHAHAHAHAYKHIIHYTPTINKSTK